MSENKELNNKELNEVSGGMISFVKDNAEVSDTSFDAVMTVMSPTKKTNIWQHFVNALKGNITFIGSDSESKNNSMDDLFAEEKKGVAGPIESFIKSLKNLFKF